MDHNTDKYHNYTISSKINLSDVQTKQSTIVNNMPSNINRMSS